MSIKNSQTSHDYIDGKGHVFTKFLLQELSRHLHISQRKVRTCINHLKEANLIVTDKVSNRLRFYVYEPSPLPIPDQTKMNSEKMIVFHDFDEADIIGTSMND